MSLSKTKNFLFFESVNYVKATRRLLQESSLWSKADIRNPLYKYLQIQENVKCRYIRIKRSICKVSFLDMKFGNITFVLYTVFVMIELILHTVRNRKEGKILESERRCL